MQNAAFRALGLEAAYVPLRCAADAIAGLMASFAAAGGGGNVTIPHKTTAAHALTQPSAWVRAIDACNTFWGEESGAGIHGDNTDIAGVLGALDALKVPAGPWLLAGTGGSARAVVAAARERGAALAVTSRDANRQAAFATWAAESLGVAAAEPSACRVLINATPLGLQDGDDDPVPAAVAPRAGAVLDLVYRRGETGFVRRARARGLIAADGREVLVRQGAAAFMRWFPSRRPPVDIMRAAVNAILG
jgi:shikimate dehydrogenase